jgi:hypothetical protein
VVLLRQHPPLEIIWACVSLGPPTKPVCPRAYPALRTTSITGAPAKRRMNSVLQRGNACIASSAGPVVASGRDRDSRERLKHVIVSDEGAA